MNIAAIAQMQNCYTAICINAHCFGPIDGAASFTYYFANDDFGLVITEIHHYLVP